MMLREWLRENDVSGSEFARRIGSSQAAVNRYLNHGRIPEAPIMRRIFAATGGAVTANDFYGWQKVAA